MDERIELLISLGASAAANCAPCFEYYYKKAAPAGLTAEEVQRTVELADKIKTGSSIYMRKTIREIAGNNGDSDRQADGTADPPCCG